MDLNFQFKTQNFEGPLDVLLSLIEDNELPVNEVSLALVTEQFLNYIRSIEQIDPGVLAGFLTIAGKLLIIKSKSLLPTLEVEIEEIDNLDLTSQLLLLKKYKQAAFMLENLESRKKQAFIREQTVFQKKIFYPDENVNVNVLAEIVKKITSEIKKDKPPEHSITEVISISEKIDHLQNLLTKKIEFAFHEILEKSQSKTETIVTFLALLELSKQKILTIEQKEIFATITIKKINDRQQA